MLQCSFLAYWNESLYILSALITYHFFIASILLFSKVSPTIWLQISMGEKELDRFSLSWVLKVYAKSLLVCSEGACEIEREWKRR